MPQVEPYHRFVMQGPLAISTGCAYVDGVNVVSRLETEQQHAQIERPGGEPWIANSVRIVVEYVES